MFFLAATAALALSSCTSDELVQDQPVVEDGAVVFSAYTGRTNRATADLITSAQELAQKGGFGVFGYEHGKTAWNVYRASNTYPNFFYNQNVTGTNVAEPVWSYAPVKYFSNNEGAQHSFFAYAPYDKRAKVVFTTEGPAIRYVAGEDSYDLLWADPTTNLTKRDIHDKINFDFKHALSKVSFKATTFVDAVHSGTTHTEGSVAANTEVVLRSIKFAGNVPSKGLLSLSDGKWKIEASEESAYEFCPAEGVTFNNTNNTEDGISNNNMVIPTDAATKVKVQVVYDVITTDAANPKNSSTITNTVTSQDEFELVAGTAYKFCLDLGLTSVKFSAAVAGWDSDSNVEVDVPNNHYFHLINSISLSADPTAMATFNEQATVATTGLTNDAYYYETSTNILYVADGSGNRTNAAVNSYNNGQDIYTVSTAGSACVKTTPAAYVLSATSAKVWETSAWAAKTPTALYSLNVNSKGEVQTDATTWTAPTADAYYTFDGKLYQWKTAAH